MNESPDVAIAPAIEAPQISDSTANALSSETGKAFFYVAENEGRVIGFAHIGDRGNGWELLRIYLLPEHMGGGIGTRFIQLGEHFLRTKKASKYVTFVHKDNFPAIGFYKRNDFVREPDMDKKEINEQCWSKKL